MTRQFDVVFVADARFQGGTSTALAVEIREAASAGLKTGLLMVKGPILTRPFPVHAEVRRCLDDDLVSRIDPADCVTTDLVLIHHPSILQHYFQPRPQFNARKVIVVLHHPTENRVGTVQYDLATIVNHARAAFDRPVFLAPVSAVVRRSLPPLLPAGSEVLPEDWHNLIDIAGWPQRGSHPPATPVKIGRHSRPDIQKWPDTLAIAKSIYPPGDDYTILMLGGGTFLAEKYGEIPRNWCLLPFDFTGVAEFLRQLDFYVYFHSDAWSEAFGRTILEALAVGLVTILPDHLEPLFGDAALYATPCAVEPMIRQYMDPALYQEQSRKARHFVETHHVSRRFRDRILPHLSPDEDTASSSRHPIDPLRVRVEAPLPKRRVLFISSNGIGMGHLSRQMAIANRLPATLDPAFATMSYAIKLVIESGYQAHYLTHNTLLGADTRDWNIVLAEELFEIIRHLRPPVIVYDATAVFKGAVEAFSMFPEIFTIWIRRPMWRSAHGAFLDYAHNFDAVIEPGELADDFDRGPTKSLRQGTYVVPPVLHVAPSQRLDRQSARGLLDLPVDDTTVVAMQLGSGSNYDMNEARSALIAAVLSRPSTILLELSSPIRPPGTTQRTQHPRHMIRELFPAFRYSNAWDAAIATAGYNTFHENILGAIPTLFVPNEADGMDIQLNRARWAHLNGSGWLMRRDFDLPWAADLVAHLFDPQKRDAVAHRCRAIQWQNGAKNIAHFIEDHARLVRSDRSPAVLP